MVNSVIQIFFILFSTCFINYWEKNLIMSNYICIFLLSVVSLCPLDLEVFLLLLLSAFTFKIAFLYIFYSLLLIWPLYQHKVFLFSKVISSAQKSTLSGITIFLWLYFTQFSLPSVFMIHLLKPSTFNLLVYLYLIWVSYIPHTVVYCSLFNLIYVSKLEF